jgi:hypothetical protein
LSWTGAARVSCVNWRCRLATMGAIGIRPKRTETRDHEIAPQLGMGYSFRALWLVLRHEGGRHSGKCALAGVVVPAVLAINCTPEAPRGALAPPPQAAHPR